MDTILVTYFLSLIILVLCGSENDCNLEGDVTVEKKLDDKRILTISTIGIKQCSKECSSISGCLSFNYERSSLTCVLNYADHNTETLATDSNGEYHKSQTNKSIGNCNSTICGLYSRCININFYGPFCIPRFCPEPPQTIQQGNLVPGGENAVGKDRTYTCNTGYILVGSPNITCQSDGTWSAFQLCKDCGQPPAITGANVNSGSTLIGSTRTYTCLPEHHTEEGSTSIYCQSNAIWTTCTLYCRPYRWPLGTYGLYKASGGCPTAGASWSEGYILQDVEDSNPGTGFSPDLPTNMAGSFNIRDITHYYCMRLNATQTGDELPWPTGNYCIVQKYSCPTGFSSGYIFWDDEDSYNYNKYVGTLPNHAMTHSKDTLIGYCCREDGLAENPIKLPTSKPFYLLRKSSTCQLVDGMNVVEQFIRYDVEDTNPTSHSSGSHPYVSETVNWNLKFCYYYK